VILAIGACFFWGYSTHRAAGGTPGLAAALQLTAWSQGAGLALLIPWILSSGATLSHRDAAYGLLSGAAVGLSLVLLYDACCRMSPGLASAVSAAVAAIFVLVHTIATGVSPSALAVVSLFASVLGVGLISTAMPRSGNSRTIAPLAEAALSGAVMAVYYIALALVSNVAYVVTVGRSVSTFMLTLLVVMSTRPVASWRMKTPPLRLILSVGFSGVIGTLAYGYAATTTSMLVSIVAIASLAPVVTALLGYWRRGERFTVMQMGGLAACILAATLATVSIIPSRFS
jgi:uncharacterized membrane protein